MRFWGPKKLKGVPKNENKPKGLKVSKEDQKADRHDDSQAEMGRDRHSELLMTD